jgi:hypothetical protein
MVLRASTVMAAAVPTSFGPAVAGAIFDRGRLHELSNMITNIVKDMKILIFFIYPPPCYGDL